MRRFAAYLLLAAGIGLVLETGLIRADDDGNQPGGERAERLKDGDAPGPGRGRRGERGRGRRGPGDGGRPEGGRGHHGPPPIIAALDADSDGVISASEIEGAVAALKTLDKNEDGKLTMEELHPKRPGRGGPRRGEFGPPGDGGPGDRGPGGRRGDREGRGGPPSPEQFIKRAMESDTDGDGKISKDEAPERMLRGFDHIDADGNGLIEKSELEEAAKRIGRRRGPGRRGEGRPGKDGPGGRRKRDRQPAPDDSEA